VLEVRGLHVAYGALPVLRALDLRVGRGEIVAVIGSNGAGKSTLLRAISGLAPVVGGTIVLDGRRIDGQRPDAVAALGVAHVPQGRQVIPDLSVEDNLLLGAYRLRGRRERVTALIEREYSRFPRLRERRTQLGGSLSGGEQQMLAIARGLMMAPEFIMMDEPSLGLAPRIVDEIMGAIRDLNQKEGLTVLLVEQAAAYALMLAGRAYVLKNGEVFLSGPAVELREDERVVRGYLGG
jgi:branched-chain amino acid transport system ATP-binding protein